MGAISMKIDFGSLAFGYKIESGGGTPNWATSFGQGDGYKIKRCSAVDELIAGMLYSSFPIINTNTKIGKGGTLVSEEDKYKLIINAALFTKVYVNGHYIEDGKFLLLVTKDNSQSHSGRLRLKYGPSNQFTINHDLHTNQEIYNKIKKQLNLNDNACWFATDIDIKDQDQLHLSIIIVNKEKQMTYTSAKEQRERWNELLGNDVQEICDIGYNQIIYGVPGCGKSYFIKEKYEITDDNSRRVVFHPDYTYSDFVGQILPVTMSNNLELKAKNNSDDVDYYSQGSVVKYVFQPGPFTEILQQCYKEENKETMQYLVIEEINRGNASAIFGDVFQLLDRNEYGISEYGISNKEIAEKLYGKGKENERIKLPSNLTILATMNTADQNVFTLDTAFKRRWEMKALRNNFKKSDDTKVESHLAHKLCDTNIDWRTFATTINKILLEGASTGIGNEDKRLGHFFLKKEEMKDVEKFSEKVIMYLWNDVFKFDRESIFSTAYNSLEDVLDAFADENIRFDIFIKEFKWKKTMDNTNKDGMLDEDIEGIENEEN